ncbi:MAG: MFS transporter [Nanoarchaeota archaeon]|nr:MFS transporter [Nanoarchaeota archaeon]
MKTTDMKTTDMKKTNMKQAYERNIPLMNVYSVLIKRVSMPIIILYFLLNNLNYTQIGILASVVAIFSLLLEIPGGIFADLNGRKNSLLISSFFGLLTMLLYFFGNSFYFFLIASVAYGISGAFISGTRESLLYDTLKKLKKTAQFKKYNGRNLFYSHFFNALILLAIPVLYVYDQKLPFLIGILFFAASFIVALFLVEPQNVKVKQIKVETLMQSYRRKFFDSLKEILSKKLLIAILFFGTITAAFMYSSSEFFPPLLQISGLQVIYFGVVYALMRAIMGFAGMVTHRLERYFRIETLLVLGAAFILVSLIGFSYGVGIIIILSILVLNLSQGFTRILLDDEVNKRVTSSNRTTIMSISNLADSLLNACLVFVFGILADKNGVQGMFVYGLVFFLVLAFASLFYLRMNLSKS